MDSPESCTLCGSQIRLVQINFTEAIRLCPNVKCKYPFNVPNTDIKFVARTVMRDTEKERTANEKDVGVVTSPPECLVNESHDLLDDILGNWSGDVAMSEDDIKAIDSIFEDLQNNTS